jgi:hypothetical protein
MNAVALACILSTQIDGAKISQQSLSFSVYSKTISMQQTERTLLTMCAKTCRILMNN